MINTNLFDRALSNKGSKKVTLLDATAQSWTCIEFVLVSSLDVELSYSIVPTYYDAPRGSIWLEKRGGLQLHLIKS